MNVDKHKVLAAGAATAIAAAAGIPTAAAAVGAAHALNRWRDSNTTSDED